MRVILLVLFAFAALAIIGCALTPEQAKKLDEFEKNISAVTEESKAVAEQIKRLYLLQQEVREQYKKGELTPEVAMKRIEELSKEAKEAAEHYAFLEEKGKALVADYKELKDQGVPWYQTAWAIVASVVAAYFGKSTFGLKGAVTALIRGVEKGNHKPTKEAIAKTSNGIVTKYVDKLTPVRSGP